MIIWHILVTTATAIALMASAAMEGGGREPAQPELREAVAVTAVPYAQAENIRSEARKKLVDEEPTLVSRQAEPEEPETASLQTDQRRGGDEPAQQQLQLREAGARGSDSDGIVLGELDLTARGGRGMTASGDMSIGAQTPVANAGLNASGDLKAGKGCSIQCITSGVAYAVGVGAKLEVKTDTPAKIAITVSDGKGYNKTVSSAAGQYGFSALFDDLEPGMTYQAKAVAEDSEGFKSEGKGSFETMMRKVEINFIHANVYETKYGKNAMKAAYRINGEWQYDDLLHPFLDPKDNLYDPTWLGLGIKSIKVDNPGRHLEFWVQLLQGGSGDICEGVTFPSENPIHGTVACWSWATAMTYGPIDLDAGLPAGQAWTSNYFETTLVVPYSGYAAPMYFDVPVHVHVSYVMP